MSISYNLRTYVHNLNGSVMIRVRWEHKTRTVVFACGVFAEKNKWDEDQQKAQKNTVHSIGGHEYSARQINSAVAEMKEIISDAFSSYDGAASPTTIEIKELVKQKFIELHPKYGAAGESHSPSAPLIHVRSVSSVFDEFIAEQKEALKWRGTTSEYHYKQVKANITECLMEIRGYGSMPISDLDTRFMNEFKRWYVNNHYYNKTTKRHIKFFKTVMRWAKAKGYPVKDEVLYYKNDLEDPEKVVIFLKYDELVQFMNYNFPPGGHLDKARDLFCFMAFTSLRHSDLKKLKKEDVSGETIKIYTQKTHKQVLIPISSRARQIINKYINSVKGELLFKVPATQNFNYYAKAAAKIAGLDRIVTEVHGEGKDLIQATRPLYEAISCHVARKTFVCISLRLGIPAEIVMKSTGHETYAAMKPYIEIMEDAVTEQMQKWDQTLPPPKKSLDELKAEMMEIQKQIAALEKE